MKQPLAIVEIRRHDWASLRVANDQPLDVPECLEGLIRSTSEDEAAGFYWGLENVVYVQGELFDAALPVVPVVLAALGDETSRPARLWLLEVLFQIVNGRSPESPTLVERCRDAAREGLWTLYRELYYGHAEAAQAVLDVLVPGSATTAEVLRARGTKRATASGVGG
jgi:hypothetical protein